MPVSAKASKKREEDLLRQREAGFDLSGVSRERLPQYNALLDTNLRHHFESPLVQQQLCSLGLVDPRGRIIDLDKEKAKLSIIDQEFKLAEAVEKRRERDEQEMRRRVQLQRHEAIQQAHRREKLRQLKEEQRVAREIVQAAKGYGSVGKPGSKSP